MAIEKSAVREGTRWDLCGRAVVVDTVAGGFVVFHDPHGPRTRVEAMALDAFLEKAGDPLRAEHARLMDGLLHATHGLPTDSDTGKTLAALRDVAIYLLERMPPTLPAYVEPAPPTPKAEPAPVIIEAERLCSVADESPVEDWAIAMPADEPPSVNRRFR